MHLLNFRGGDRLDDSSSSVASSVGSPSADLQELRNMRSQFHDQVHYIIATTKIRNNYGVIQSFKFLFFMAPCKVITLNPLCILFVSVLCFFFDGSLSKVIALPTIADSCKIDIVQQESLIRTSQKKI